MNFESRGKKVFTGNGFVSPPCSELSSVAWKQYNEHASDNYSLSFEEFPRFQETSFLFDDPEDSFCIIKEEASQFQTATPAQPKDRIYPDRGNLVVSILADINSIRVRYCNQS